jgi:hypothetical protein
MQPPQNNEPYQSKILLGLLLLLLSCSGLAAIETVQTGVATAQTNSEIGNIELLRQRAIRNAMELALMEVKGISVTSEKADAIRSSQKTHELDGEESQVTSQESRFRGSALSRTEGHVRLIEIIREWNEGEQYHVEAKLEVSDLAEAAQKQGAGYYWERIGKPKLSIALAETLNSASQYEKEPYTLRFFRDVLAKNGLQVAEAGEVNSRYHIAIHQDVSYSIMQAYGTHTVNSNLSFRIIDHQLGRMIAEERRSCGPQAGFALEAAKRDCMKEIAPQLSELLIKQLALAFNDQWNHGDEYVLHISGLPGVHVAEAVDAIHQGFRVKSGRMDSYRDGVLTMTVSYQGMNADLTRAVVAAFDDIGHQVEPESVASNEISFRWKNSLNQ